MQSDKSDHRIKNYTSVNFFGFLVTSFAVVMFAVFMSATQPYFITDALGIDENVGNYIGSLGFYDELLSMILVPFAGVMSDKIGTKPLVCFGFLVIGFSFFGFGYTVKEKVYPGMLFWRLVFSLGLTCSLGILNVLLFELNNSDYTIRGLGRSKGVQLENDTVGETLLQAAEGLDSQIEQNEETGTNQATTLVEIDKLNRQRSDGRKVAIMGTMSGLGAVFAVAVLLRLPVYFGKTFNPGDALRKSYFAVGLIAILLSILMSLTLYSNKRAEQDELDQLFAELDVSNAQEDASYQNEDHVISSQTKVVFGSTESYWQSIRYGVFLSLQDPMILIAYFGGFISRCITITISLFVPFYINHYFISSGKCSNVELDKKQCSDSYILSSILTGLANTAALAFAPVIGILVDKLNKLSLLLHVANLVSIAAFASMCAVVEPDKSPLVFISASVMGLAEICFIVISTTMLSNITSQDNYYGSKGSISGVSSFVGGIGILFVSKIGGLLADVNSKGPFFLLILINLGFFVVMLVVKSGSSKKRVPHAGEN